ncbi:MAG: hypothetical protein P4L31_08220 [Candidatus Babeliales bacterium]|nr:hypothetical protein [Candidatus Babeliales bacterium]
MNIKNIFAVVLIASASQVAASGALIKVGKPLSHISRTALLATAAGHKHVHPICVQKRDWSENTLARGLALQTMLVPVLFGGSVYERTGDIGVASCAFLASGIVSYKITKETCMHIDTQAKKIYDLEQQLDSQNKAAEICNKKKCR